MTKLSFVFGCIVLLAAFEGCSKKTVSDLVGTYTAEWSFGRETLSLHADGKYEQRFLPTNPTLKPVDNAGTWHFDGETLTLEDPIIVQDMYGDGASRNYSQKHSGAIVVLHVTSLFGKLVIPASANTDVQYKRQ